MLSEKVQLSKLCIELCQGQEKKKIQQKYKKNIQRKKRLKDEEKGGLTVRAAILGPNGLWFKSRINLGGESDRQSLLHSH